MGWESGIADRRVERFAASKLERDVVPASVCSDVRLAEAYSRYHAQPLGLERQLAGLARDYPADYVL